MIAGRDGDRLAALAGETGATPQRFEATEVADVERCVKLAVERHGQVDGVVNCVGSLPRSRTAGTHFLPFTRESDEERAGLWTLCERAAATDAHGTLDRVAG